MYRMRTKLIEEKNVLEMEKYTYAHTKYLGA